MDHVAGVIIEAKRRIKDPYIVVSGDFNQWEIGDYLEDFRDIGEVNVGPTRGTRSIDRSFTNFETVRRCGTLPPLQTDGEDGHIRESDHLITYLEVRIPRGNKYKWLSYSYRYNNKESEEKFGRWLAQKDWAAVIQAPTSNQKADLYQAEILAAIEDLFPLRTIRRRDIDPPWINSTIKTDQA